MSSDDARLCVLDDNILIAVLQLLDNDKARASLACVSKTWKSCVQRSWNRIHLCFDSEGTLTTQLTWLACQLVDCPLLLQSLELHSKVRLAPTSTNLGLERFSALRHLDMQALCDNSPEDASSTRFLSPQPSQEAGGPRFILGPAAVRQLAALSGSLQKLSLAFDEGSQPSTLHAFSALTGLTDLNINLTKRANQADHFARLELAESLTGLCKLQALGISGSSVGEEKPGLLNKMLEGITSLSLRGRTMLCSDIASSTLRCLTVMFFNTGRLPVAECPQLQELLHTAHSVTAMHLRQYAALQSLSDCLCASLPVGRSLVAGLTPLTGLQHLDLTQYQCGDDGFSEMLLFEGLRSLRLQLDHPPHRLYLAEGFSKLTALTTLELGRSFCASHYQPTFSGEVDHLPVLEVLSVECRRVEATVLSSRLVDVEISGSTCRPLAAWPLLSHYHCLRRLSLKCLPSSVEQKQVFEQLPIDCHSLQELQLTYAYSAVLADEQLSLMHGREVESLISRVLALGTLRALQVAAVYSSPRINMSSMAASGLQHLALACGRLSLGSDCSYKDSPPMPSIHLLTWGGISSVRHLQACMPALHCTAVGDPWLMATMFKHGPQHNLDLDIDDVMDELSAVKMRAEDSENDSTETESSNENVPNQYASNDSDDLYYDDDW